MINLNLPPDKANHFFWGAIIGVVVNAATSFVWSPVWAAEVGAGVALGAGVLKERYDGWKNAQLVKAGKLETSKVEWLDWVMTALGGAAVNGVQSFHHLVK